MHMVIRQYKARVSCIHTAQAYSTIKHLIRTASPSLQEDHRIMERNWFFLRSTIKFVFILLYGCLFILIFISRPKVKHFWFICQYYIYSIFNRNMMITFFRIFEINQWNLNDGISCCHLISFYFILQI